MTLLGDSVAIRICLLKMFKPFDPVIQNLRIYAWWITNDVNIGYGFIRLFILVLFGIKSIGINTNGKH